MQNRLRNSFIIERNSNKSMAKPIKENENIYDYSNFVHVPDKINGTPLTLVENGVSTKMYLVKNKINSRHYLNKFYTFDNVPKLRKKVTKELNSIQKFSHENIIKVYSQSSNEINLNIILDYGVKGTLASLVARQGRMDEDKSFFYFYQVLNGINHIHSNSYILRNLKLENILIDENDRILLSDLSMCQKNKRKKIQFYDQSEDLWSLGLILYLLTQGIKTDITEKEDEEYTFKYRVSKECQDLIETLLYSNTALKTKHIYDHPWIKYYLAKPKKESIHKLKELAQIKTDCLKDSLISKITHRSSKSEFCHDISFDAMSLEADQFLETQTSTKGFYRSMSNKIDVLEEEVVDNNTSNISHIFFREYSNTIDGVELLKKAKNAKAKEMSTTMVIQKKTNFWDKFTEFFTGKKM